MSDGHLTIIIPTYNRPYHLCRLLHYFKSRQTKSPILVLDSSNEDNRKLNRESLQVESLNLTYKVYDETLNQFVKYLDGLEIAETPYAVICADDDFLFTETALTCVDFLESNPDYVMCHGHYFNFAETHEILITLLQYRGPSITSDDSVSRVNELMGRYEATFYGVHRTKVLLDVMKRIQNVKLLLTRELLAAALTAVHGKIFRLPVFYFGRNEEILINHQLFHPTQFLAQSPQLLFDEYQEYKSELMKGIQEVGTNPFSPEQAGHLLDLGHLAYMAEFLEPGVLRLIMRRTTEGATPRQICLELWNQVVPTTRLPCKRVPYKKITGLDHKIRNWRLALLDKGTKPFRYYLNPKRDRVIKTAAPLGGQREYVFCDEFLFPRGSNDFVEHDQVIHIKTALDHLPTLEEMKSAGVTSAHYKN